MQAKFKEAVVLQILDLQFVSLRSSGHHCNASFETAVSPAYQDEVMERGKVKTKAMAEKAQGEGIALEVAAVESEDILSTAAAEAKKGYNTIFLQREKRKLFPLSRERSPGT